MSKAIFKPYAMNQINELLEVIETENAKEKAEYGEQDLESKGGGGNREETVQALNERLKGERSQTTRQH